MRLKKKNNFFILKFLSTEVSKNKILSVQKVLSLINGKVAFDLINVKSICNEFLDFLRDFSNKKNIAIYNVCPELCCLFFMTKNNKQLDFYNNEIDLFEQKQQLVNRKFYICK